MRINPLDDMILRALKTRYFMLAVKEDMGKTPEITKELDDLQAEIRRRIEGAQIQTHQS